jgi:hypothetical protein
MPLGNQQAFGRFLELTVGREALKGPQACGIFLHLLRDKLRQFSRMGARLISRHSSPLVNSAKYDGPECVQPVADDEIPSTGQLSFLGH